MDLVGEYTSGLDVAKVRQIAEGLKMVRGDVTAYKLGQMLHGMMDLAQKLNQLTGTDYGRIWTPTARPPE